MINEYALNFRFSIGKYTHKFSRTAMSSASEAVMYVSQREMNTVIKVTNAEFDDFYGVYRVSCRDIPTFPGYQQMLTYC
jgi:hypothetical protein